MRSGRSSGMVKWGILGGGVRFKVLSSCVGLWVFGFGGGSLCRFVVGVSFGCEEGSGPLVMRSNSLSLYWGGILAGSTHWWIICCSHCFNLGGVLGHEHIFLAFCL